MDQQLSENTNPNYVKRKTMRRKQRGSFAKHIFAGTIAGAVSRTMIAPLERIQLILQTQKLLRVPESDKYSGIIDAIRRIPREQGFFSLWRGNFANIIKIVPNIAGRFSIYDKYKMIFMPEGQEYTGVNNVVRRALGGFSAGLITLSFTYPIEVIRVRLTLDMASKGEQRNYNSMTDCLKKIVKQEGFRSLYNGYSLNCLGLAPYLAISFTCYDLLKEYLINTDQEGLNNSNLTNFINYMGIGSLSGILAQFCVHPLDTVRRRIQINGAQNYDKLYAGIIDCMKTMYKKEGFRSFYFGLILSLIKIAPSAALQFSVYDSFKQFLFE